MKRIGLILSVATSLTFAMSEPPEGFKDPKVLAGVMAGELITTTEIEAPYEGQKVVRSFFKKVSKDMYLALLVDYPKYPDIFPEVLEGKVLSVNPAKTEYDYWLKVLVKVGMMSQNVFPEGRHTINRGADLVSEATAMNVLNNYKENISIADQKIRLIPWEGGILVEDRVHVKAAKQDAMAKIAKQKFMEFFGSYTEKFRKELQGE